MQGSPSSSHILVRGPHLDCATYRGILRLFSYCGRLQSQARPASSPARGPDVASEFGVLEIISTQDASTLEEVKLSAYEEKILPEKSEELREDGGNDETSVDATKFQQPGVALSEQEPLATAPGFQAFSEKNQCASSDAVSHNDIEEGEISGEAGVSDSSGDVESGAEEIQQEKLPSEKIGEQTVPRNLSSEVRVNNGEIQREAVEVRERKKKVPLTESRREKKKLAKKRKRAETNKKLGVKRLKLDMPVKTKKVFPCNFFLKGRCQKGVSCKFSHDLIPDTKSTPCSFFARGTCLKGDDCPFDHDLSKYPCHIFASEGWCGRGENCRFSHKVSSGELPSASATGQKQIPQKSLTLTSSNAKSSASINPVMKMPKGISFLSFAKDSPLSSGDHETGHELTFSQKSSRSKLLNGDRCLGPLEKNPTLVQKNSGISSHESGAMDEASRLLEEFLFSGISS